ncbi:chitin synthase III catalytic subunit [Clohesyomyces aquaticus]|uniref:Chitin synthase III catalytic subunit n=1 Tax=Clohesyomyces aquaticus TaxID=1231657 RepID=A0A1Y1ZJY8_9PLEO|nr:chitin synthase III catalytic subunit [Clohesyomyces aquaticus]
MPGTAYGNFHDFCRDTGNLASTLPVCNLFDQSSTRLGTGWGGCNLTGIPLSNGRHLANLGSILVCALAIVASLFLIWRSERKKAAVGRREMQLFLVGFIIIEICEIFTVGGFPLNSGVRRAFTAVHIAAIVSTLWILMLNGIVGYQLLDDGTPMSVGLMVISAALIFIGTGYIALDTGFSWTGYWDSTLTGQNRAYALYTLYQLVPLVFLVVFFLLEAFLVLRILGERKPMVYLVAAALLFAIGQVFQYVISVHICNGTDGKINGGLFETLFTLLAVVTIWFFWSSITEDDWPMPTVAGAGAYQ